jgi:hypothetical protein
MSDDTSPLEVMAVFSDMTPEQYPSGTVVSLSWLQPDGTEIVYNGTIDWRDGECWLSLD